MKTAKKMKFLVTLALISISLFDCEAVTYNFTTIGSTNGYNCMYWKNETRLVCQVVNGGGLVSCETVLEIPSLNVSVGAFGVGIGNDTFVVDQSTGILGIHLYPKNLTSVGNDTYLNHTIVDTNGVTLNLVLYSADKFYYNGLRVLDHDCFSNLVSILNSTQLVHHTVQVAQLGDSNANAIIGGDIVIGTIQQKVGGLFFKKRSFDRRS